MTIKILGIAAYYHDSAAALIEDGHIVAAAQEERFTRKKHDPNFPLEAVRYVLSEADCSLGDIDYIVFYDKPFIKFERLLETYIATAPWGFKSFCLSMPIWLKEKLFQKSLLLKSLQKIDDTAEHEKKILFSEHHYSHAASAYFPSPYNKAVVLTLDGVGEWATTTVAIGRGKDLEIVREIHYPHSLGLLYSAFTYYTGFKVNSGEYKLMGLAPYGVPLYQELILDNIIDLKEDGSFRLDQSYFNYSTGLTMTNKKFERLFGQPVRHSEYEPLTQFHMDIAASIQAALEYIVLRITRSLAREYKGFDNLCLAGGVALNCVANGKLARDGAFKNIWIQPAAGDAGGAIGAALAAWYRELGHDREVRNCDAMQGTYLGPSYSSEEAIKSLSKIGAVYTKVSKDEMLSSAAQALNDGKAIGWFQGRMEFGPRALGGRSILGNPTLTTTQKTLNLKVKYRESFRPFAPAVLREDVGKYFDFNQDSPYMLFVGHINSDLREPLNEQDQELFGIDKLNIKRSVIPAVTHVDYSARIQTVHYDTNPIFHDLINRFKQLSGHSVLVNTSFNVRGEPIVCSPEDAFNCFMGTELDMLIIGNIILYKEQQPKSLIQNYKNKYELD